MTSVVTHIAAAIAVGSVGAAFGSISAALVDLYRHRRDRPPKPHRPRCTKNPRGMLYAIYDDPRFWAAMAAGMAWTLGLVLMLGGKARITASAYSDILATGGPVVWGSAFMMVAVITWICAWWFPHLLGWAMVLEAIPFGGIALMFAIAAVQYSDANVTAAPVYAWIMIMHAALADYCRREY